MLFNRLDRYGRALFLRRFVLQIISFTFDGLALVLVVFFVFINIVFWLLRSFLANFIRRRGFYDTLKMDYVMLNVVIVECFLM